MYQFPTINTIQDVLPAIAGNQEFIVIEKDDFTVIDYVLAGPHTFPNPCAFHYSTDPDKDYDKLKRECRGIIFDKEGKIMSRPLHKFFNYGEKPEEEKNLTNPPEHILMKLDGSMIRPLKLNGHIRLATRKGVTDVAMQAEVFIADKPHYVSFMEEQIAEGRTPVFEWCSPFNRIVLDYDVSCLHLLAIRDNVTGHYMSYDFIQSLGKKYDIPVVPEFIFPPDVDLIQYVKELKEAEGCVLIYKNGHKVKAKGDWYVTLHKAKDKIGREKDMIKVFLSGEIDDLLPLFSEKDQKEINEYLDKVTTELLKTITRVQMKYNEILCALPKEFTRKDFALAVMGLDPKYKSFMFSMFAGDPAIALITELLIKVCGKNTTLDANRWLIGGIKFKDKSKDAD